MSDTRFEKARILGARALQLALGAPALVVPAFGVIDPIRIAELEFEAGSLPLTATRAPHARY